MLSGEDPGVWRHFGVRHPLKKEAQTKVPTQLGWMPARAPTHHHPQGMPSLPCPLVLSGPCTALSAKAAWASILLGFQLLSDTNVCPQVL